MKEKGNIYFKSPYFTVVIIQIVLEILVRMFNLGDVELWIVLFTAIVLAVWLGKVAWQEIKGQRFCSHDIFWISASIFLFCLQSWWLVKYF